MNLVFCAQDRVLKAHRLSASPPILCGIFFNLAFFVVVIIVKTPNFFPLITRLYYFEQGTTKGT